MAKKELIPAKQEKARERIKNFRSELVDYRRSLEQFKKDREDSVCYVPCDQPQLYLQTPLQVLDADGVSLQANDSEPHRIARAKTPPHSDPRKPLCAIHSRSELRICSEAAPVSFVWRCSARLQPGDACFTRAKFHVLHQCCVRRISRAGSSCTRRSR